MRRNASRSTRTSSKVGVYGFRACACYSALNPNTDLQAEQADRQAANWVSYGFDGGRSGWAVFLNRPVFCFVFVKYVDAVNTASCDVFEGTSLATMASVPPPCFC